MNNVNCTTYFGVLLFCTKIALKMVQCAALIAPYGLRQSDGAVLLIAMPRHQGNNRGDLRPQFSIMPPFKLPG